MVFKGEVHKIGCEGRAHDKFENIHLVQEQRAH